MKHIRETPDACYHRTAGGVVVSALRPDAAVALLHRASGEWTLPKGHIEGTESPQTAALREIAEEIGLDGLEIVADLGTVRYTFSEAGDPRSHHKEVAFFLVLSPRGQLPLSPEDIPKFRDACWVTLPEARKRCTFPEFRTVLRQAEKILAGGLHRQPS